MCHDAVTEGMNLFICLCPPFENKVNISQHNSLDMVLKYPPPTQGKISHFQKTFITNTKAILYCLHILMLFSQPTQVDCKCWDRVFPNSGKKKTFLKKMYRTLLIKWQMYVECQWENSPLYNWQLLASQMAIVICSLLDMLRSTWSYEAQSCQSSLGATEGGRAFN